MCNIRFGSAELQQSNISDCVSVQYFDNYALLFSADTVCVCFQFTVLPGFSLHDGFYFSRPHKFQHGIDNDYPSKTVLQQHNSIRLQVYVVLHEMCIGVKNII